MGAALGYGQLVQETVWRACEVRGAARGPETLPPTVILIKGLHPQEICLRSKIHKPETRVIIGRFSLTSQAQSIAMSYGFHQINISQIHPLICIPPQAWAPGPGFFNCHSFPQPPSTFTPQCVATL